MIDEIAGDIGSQDGETNFSLLAEKMNEIITVVNEYSKMSNAMVRVTEGMVGLIKDLKGISSKSIPIPPRENSGD